MNRKKAINILMRVAEGVPYQNDAEFQQACELAIQYLSLELPSEEWHNLEIFAARQIHYKIVHQLVEPVRQYFKKHPEKETAEKDEIMSKEKRDVLGGMMDLIEEMYPELKKE